MGEYHGVVVDVATRAAGFTALGHLMSVMHGRQSRTQVNERALTDALAEQAAKVEAIEDQLANLEVKWPPGSWCSAPTTEPSRCSTSGSPPRGPGSTGWRIRQRRCPPTPPLTGPRPPAPSLRRGGSAACPSHVLLRATREAQMSVRVVTLAGGALNLTFGWDGGTASLTAGTVLDVPPGSALETAIGAGNLIPLTSQALVSEQQGGGGGVSN